MKINGLVFHKLATSLILALVTLNVANISAQSATDLDFYGVCGCDLFNNTCDLNCCCDKDCSAIDKEAFLCQTQIQNNKKWCVPNSMLFFSNTPYILKSLEDLICIDINNSLALNYYTPVSNKSLTEDQVNQMVELYDPSISQQSLYSLGLNSSKTSFDRSDSVWTLFENDVLGFLTLPVQVAGLECRDGPPLKYLSNRNSTCFTKSTDYTCDGLRDTRFSINYYIRNFKILSKPSALSDCQKTLNSNINIRYYDTCGSDLLIKVKVSKCQNSTNGDCCTGKDCLDNLSQPTISDNNQLCNNMVKRATYILKYDNPSGFKDAYLNLELFDATDLKVENKLEQQFRVVFLPASSDHKATLVESSGNPGYKLGKPIKVGNDWNKDTFLDFDMFRPDSLGECPTEDAVDKNRLPVKFRINTLTECKLTLDVIPTTSEMCIKLQAKIDKIILGTQPYQFFLPFATSTFNQSQAIPNYKPTSDPTFSDRVCQSLRIYADLRIAFANEGNINNPQAKIVYFAYDWSQLTDLRPRCSTQDCITAKQPYLKISSKVTFVDVSQPPLYTESKMPKPKATLPDDFFYPIGFSSASHNKLGKFIFPLSLAYFLWAFSLSV